MTRYKKTMSEAYREVYNLSEKMSSSQIAKLKKAYEPMRDKKISTANAEKLMKIMDMVDKDKNVLIQLFKADIPFVSELAVTRLITKHKMKGAEINKLKSEALDKEDEPKVKELIKKLKGASQAHAGQAKDLEKALKEEPEHEVTVGNYTTKFFHMCGSAQTTMKKHASKDGAEELAKMQDMFYKMEKDAMESGSVSDEQKEKAQALYDKIMSKAKDVGIEDEVGKYMKMHLDSMLKGNPKLGFGRTDVSESLDEKYDLYHKTFSGAMQHAYDYAKKKMGITVDPKEIDSKVATGPRKPSEGKTNTYRLKGRGGNLQIQVYNKGGSKPFELNMYKESVELEEKFSPKEIKMAIGIASDPRYAKGNYSGAVRQIEKIKKGLSTHKQVAAVLKRQNEELDESKKALKAKSDKSGVSVGILSKVYDRGMAAWKGGHRPGTTPQQWALARVNSFLTGGGARKADNDLWQKAKGQKKAKKEEFELDEGMKYTHAVVDNNGNVIGFSTNEKDAMFMSKNNLTKKKGTVVKLTKPMSQKQGDMKVGRKLFEGSMKDLLIKGKDLEAYAKKHGGIDKKDMMKVAAMLKKGDKSGALKYTKGMDTDPRDYILDLMGEDAVKSAQDKLDKAKRIQSLKDKIKDIRDEGARADAMRAMRTKRGVDPADVDDDATDDDMKAASKNILMQLRKSVSLGKNFKVEFGDKKKMPVDPKIAQAVINKYMSFRKPMDKEKFQSKIAKSYKDMLRTMKENIHEEEDKPDNTKFTDRIKKAQERVRNATKGTQEHSDALDALQNAKDAYANYKKKTAGGKFKSALKKTAIATGIGAIATAKLGDSYDPKIKREAILDRIDKKLEEKKNG